VAVDLIDIPSPFIFFRKAYLVMPSSRTASLVLPFARPID
jgi:hypothetical protein